MPPFRLVASDIDGTLIRTDGTLSPRTIGVLDQLYSRGIPTVLVTGRPVRWLRQLYDQMLEPLPAVCANGAVVYDPDTDEILRAAPLSVELLLDVTKRLREAVPDIALAVEVEDGRVVLVRGGWPMRWDGEHKRCACCHTRGADLGAGGQAAGPLGQHGPDEFYELVSRTLGGIAEATHSSSSALVEISAAGVTKAAGLAWLCEREGITPRTWWRSGTCRTTADADLGRPSVAMGNATRLSEIRRRGGPHERRGRRGRLSREALRP
jgi:hydroxymethylpyrimidine pyrophosphatase-like HAD family hydrolase